MITSSQMMTAYFYIHVIVEPMMNIFTHKLIIQPKDNINFIFHRDDNTILFFWSYLD
jgi:hypothetical protein